MFLYRLHVPHAFDGRAGFNMDVLTSHGVLTAVTLLVGEAVDGCARAGCKYEVRLLCSPLSQEWGLIPSCWNRSPQVQTLVSSVPFKCMFSVCLPWDLCPREAEC